jgi:hypothetical protein
VRRVGVEAPPDLVAGKPLDRLELVAVRGVTGRTGRPGEPASTAWLSEVFVRFGLLDMNRTMSSAAGRKSTAVGNSAPTTSFMPRSFFSVRLIR